MFTPNDIAQLLQRLFRGHGAIPIYDWLSYINSSAHMKPPVTFAAFLFALFSALAAEPATDSEAEQWRRIEERMRVEVGITNFLQYTNVPIIRDLVVHPSFGIWWHEIPSPTLTGTVAMASVTSFVATNGWNMHTGSLGALVFVKNRKRIRGLPWEAIRDREFQAVTHDGVLYVILRGWHHNYTGVAYNPKTNAFPRGIVGFKPLHDHWYAWSQPETPITLPQQYEGQTR
jgi:hypothetical protein